MTLSSCNYHNHAVEKVVRELTSYGKMGAVDIHRGPAQHTNGFYNVLSWMSVNMLLGNFDWKGRMCAASTFKYDGDGGGPFNLTKLKGKVTGFGISSIRHDVDYEKTTLFAGYPAKRKWKPSASRWWRPFPKPLICGLSVKPSLFAPIY